MRYFRAEGDQEAHCKGTAMPIGTTVNRNVHFIKVIAMHTRKILAVLAYAVLCVTSSLAYAGTVTFRVPVDVKAYPVPNGILSVWCELRSSQGQGIEAVGVPLKLSGGATSNGYLAQFKVNYKDEEAPNIRGYRCALVADTKGLYVSGSGSGQSSAKAIPAGATILSQVSGPLK